MPEPRKSYEELISLSNDKRRICGVFYSNRPQGGELPSSLQTIANKFETTILHFSNATK